MNSGNPWRIMQAVHPDGSQLSFYTIPEFDNWISLGHTMDWIIAPYKVCFPKHGGPCFWLDRIHPFSSI